MENTEPQKSELKPFKAPSKEMIKYYQGLYERNQTKWIRRASLEVSHLGSEFEYEGKKLTLIGTIDPLLMLVKENDDKYYRLDCNIVSEMITGKR